MDTILYAIFHNNVGMETFKNSMAFGKGAEMKFDRKIPLCKRSVKRLEGVTKSKVFSQLSSSLSGLTTIRALKAEDIMIEEFDHYQDIHSSAYFSTIG